jgi:hypothetical protein
MPFAPFSDFYLDLAKREIRTATVCEGDDVLPADTYAFFEMYCDEPGCDCRRVFFTVISERLRKPLAVVAYGWESLDFYRRWMKGAPVDPKLLQGPILDPGSPQSKYAPALLSLIDDVVLADPAYVERLKRHYRMVRDVVDRNAPRGSVPVPDRRLDAAERKRILAAKMRELQARRSQKKRAR